MSMRRPPLFVVALVCTALAVGLGVRGDRAARAADGRTVDITKSSSIVTRQTTAFRTQNDPGRCVLVAFAMYPDVEGATGYSVHVRGLPPSSDVRGGGPPFPDDAYELGDGRGGVAATFTVPGNSHWFPVHSQSRPDGCGEAEAYVKSHLSIASATAVRGDVTEGAIEGTVLTTPDLRPLVGVSIRAVGTGGAAGRAGTAKTNAKGAYRIERLRPGPYTVTASVARDLDLEPPAQAVTVTAGGTARADFRAKGASELRVVITATPEEPFVEQAAEGPKPEDVTFTVKVTNRSKRAIDGVTFPAKLTIGRLTNPYEFLAQKLDPRSKKPVKPVKLTVGSLAPGQTKSLEYAYVADGDGTASVEALVIGHRGFARVTGLGKTNVRVGTDVLFVTAKLDRDTPSPKGGGLIKAGTPFSLLVEIENRSNERKVMTEPHLADAIGNVRGGVWRKHSAGPLDTFVAQSQSRPPSFPLFTIEPRRSVELDAVFVTDASSYAFDAATAREAGPADPVGGVRAEVTVGKPLALAPPAGEPKAAVEDWVKLDEKEIELVAGEGKNRFRISLDDSGMTKRPWNPWADPAVAHSLFTVGAGVGLVNWAWGTVRGIVYDLPVLLGRGVVGLPAAVQTYTEYAVALWENADAATRAQYLLRLHAAVLSMGNTEFAVLVKKKGPSFWRTIDDAVLDEMTRMTSEWYGGDWQKAAQLAGIRTGQVVPDIATLPVIELQAARWARGAKLAVLADMPQATRALAAAARLRLDDVRRVVNDRLRAVSRLGADEAIDILRHAVKPVKAGIGFVYEDFHLASLYGLTKEQARWLRNFARENHVLITIRSRAVESIRWIKQRKAYLKPEEIKTKNVNYHDVDYLGYAEADIGRVVLSGGPPPSEAEVIARLRRNRVPENSKEWKSVLERRKTRAGEWAELDAAWRGWPRTPEGAEMEFRWNWKENGVDPAKAPGIPPAKVRVRLRGEPEKNPRKWVPEVDAGEGWRSITGDVDVMGLTDIDGRPLPDDVYGALLEKLRKGPVGASHPTTDTWIKDGRIWFDKKAQQMEPGECCFAQFGMDGEVRAVSLDLDLSLFRQPPYDRNNFRLFWDGGVRHAIGWHKRR